MNIQGTGSMAAIYQQTSSLQNTRGSFDMPPPPDADTIMATEDTDQDGFLSVDETRLSEEMFNDADTDSDGLLSGEELEEMLANMPPPPQMGGMQPPPGEMDIDQLFEEEDTDLDGAISIAESRLSEEMFANIDQDGDGYITAEEIEESLSDRQDQRSENGSGTSFYQTMAMTAYQNSLDSYMTGNSQFLNLSFANKDQGIFA